jgi:hypothetical protein
MKTFGDLQNPAKTSARVCHNWPQPKAESPAPDKACALQLALRETTSQIARQLILHGNPNFQGAVSTCLNILFFPPKLSIRPTKTLMHHC